MKTWVGLAVAVLGMGTEISVAKPARAVKKELPYLLQCKVDTVTPEGALFFSNIPENGPVVGDTLKLDPNAYYVSDITFDSGHAIPVKEAGIKLVDRTNTPEYQSLFLGAFMSLNYDYSVFYNFYHDVESSYGELQVVQKDRDGRTKVQALEMTCTHLPRR